MTTASIRMASSPRATAIRIIPGPASPEGNGLTDINNSAAEHPLFPEVPRCGRLYMGVNSDDGFKVTVGPNPADWGSRARAVQRRPRRSRSAQWWHDLHHHCYQYGQLLSRAPHVGERGRAGPMPSGSWSRTGSACCSTIRPRPTRRASRPTTAARRSRPSSRTFAQSRRTAYRADQFSADITDLGTTVTGTPMLYLDGAQFTTAVCQQVWRGYHDWGAFRLFAAIGAIRRMLVYTTTGGGHLHQHLELHGRRLLPADPGRNRRRLNQPGFRLKPFESRVWPNSAGQPNNTRWTLEQLSGLHGPNAANLTTATDGGFMHFAERRLTSAARRWHRR